MAALHFNFPSTSPPPPLLSSPSHKFKSSLLNLHLFTHPATRPCSLPFISSYRRRSFQLVTTTLSAVDPTEATGTSGRDSEKIPLLEVKDLTAVMAESRQQILKGLNLIVHEGAVHAVMGKNGSGKSTFSKIMRLLEAVSSLNRRICLTWSQRKDLLLAFYELPIPS